MYGRGISALGAAVAIAAAVSACGGSGSSADVGGGTSTIKLGVLTSLSGPASSAFGASVGGVNARLAAYKEDAGKCASTTFDVIKADDQSSPQGSLTATQKLIQQDKAYAILGLSTTFYGASQFATTTGKATPIIGGAFDGSPQWQDTTNNLLPAGTVSNFKKTYSTTGEYFKGVGGTKVAGVGFASPSSQAGLEASLKSAEAAGLTRGYVNKEVPLGSTDVGAIVLGIMESKADVIFMTMTPDSAFAVIGGLKQAGYKTKAVISATGYGADLLKSAPAVAAGQGVTFFTSWAPSELKNAGTERMSAALKKYAGSASGVPSYAEAMGWLTADLFLHGLDVAGCDVDQAKFLSTVRADKTWNANGLYPTTRDLTTVSAGKQCIYFLRLKGNAFVPEPNAAPLCGSVVSS